MEDADNLFSLFLLGKLLGLTPDDKEVHGFLASKSNELVFNDKDKRAYEHAQFLIPYYQTLTEQTLLEDIAEQA